MGQEEQIIKEKRCFYKRLKLLGYVSYKSYLGSKHWKSKRREYYESNLPQHCLICRHERFEIHHRSYVRMGDEALGDLIPLCRICHQKVHKYIDENVVPLSHTHKAIRKVAGWTKRETKQILKQFTYNKKQNKWADHKKVDVLNPLKSARNMRAVGIITREEYLKLKKEHE